MNHVPGTNIGKPVCKLFGPENNAFSVMSLVTRTLRYAGVPKKIQNEYIAKAMKSDYKNLLQVTRRYVKVVSN